MFNVGCIEHSGIMVRKSKRERRFEYCVAVLNLAKVRSLYISCSSLNCMNEYLAVHSGGCLFIYILYTIISA